MLVGLLVFIYVIANSQPLTIPETSLKARFRVVLDSLHGRYKFPGSTAAYILADVELNRSMTPRSQILAASIGRTYAGNLVLTLARVGARANAFGRLCVCPGS